MMNCKKTKKLLPLYISDDLDRSELVAMETHLTGCLNCYREYQTYLKAHRNFKRLSEKPDLSPILGDFTNEVMNRIAEDSGGPVATMPKVTYNFVPKPLAAAVLVLLTITGFYLLIGGFGEEAVKPDNPANQFRNNLDTSPVYFNPNGWYYSPGKTDRSIGNDKRETKPKSDDEFDFVGPKPLRFPKIQPVEGTRGL